MPTPHSPVTPSEVARHYDQLDRFYRDVWGEHVHHGFWQTGRETAPQAARAMVDLVMDHALVRAGAGTRVLDVGCGYGAAARIMARERGADVTGITISPQQQRHATAAIAALATAEDKDRHLDKRLHFVCEDWLENQQASGCFDRVIAMESTEHMRDKARAFSEMARVLRPGGRVVVVAWLAANHRTHWQDAHLIEPICREAKLAALGTPAEYEAWIASAGLELEKTLDISAQVSRTWPTTAGRFLLALLRRPGHARYLLETKHNNPRFGLTMLRIWTGYRVGAVRMMLFVANKPFAQRPDSTRE